MLLKTWSYILFYAFEMPQVTVLLTLMLALVLYFDRRGVMLSYRAGDAGLSLSIERKLLTLYSSFFTLILGYFYLLNNHRLPA